MANQSDGRPSWKELLERETRKEPLLLPAAHDALTAEIIQRAGFKAYQIGGFALVGARHGWPDIDLALFADEVAGVRDIIAACSLPVLVDCDDGYGDVKNVTHTVRSYEGMGVSAIFLEDQKAPKRCGHMNNKHVVPVEVMEGKLRAAAAARSSDDSLFLLARTDAIGPNGLDDALKRCERYLKAGGDGVYFDGVESEEQLERIGREFKGTPLATSVLEQGGKTPFLPPEQFHEMGFTMILYPTTLLFRVARALEKAAADLKDGKPIPPDEGVDMKHFEEIVDLQHWKEVEKKFGGAEAKEL